MENADLPDSPAPIPFLKTSQELSAIAARDYLQTRDGVTPLPPFRAEGGTAYLYYNPGKEGVYILPVQSPKKLDNFLSVVIIHNYNNESCLYH